MRRCTTQVSSAALLTLTLGFAIPCAGSLAQQPDAAATVPLKTNPMLSLREFEPEANAEYILGRGDEISIDYGGRPELNSKNVIGPDGKVTLPMAGSIFLADKSRQEAADAVVAALKPFYASLSVTVGVDKYTSNQVLLLGAVEHPGVQTFDRPPTLLEVVTRGGASGNPRSNSGGGTGSTAFSMQASLQPAMLGVPERCAIYRGSDKVLWVNLKSLLDSGNALADIRLKRDDIIYVPSPAERYVSVLGQVQHPGALQLDSTSTLPKLIALAGGLTQEAGGNPNIQVIQIVNGKTRIVPFKQILQPSPLDLTLQSGDIIFIPESGFNKAAYIIDKLSPAITLFTGSALISH
ncbi:polysaccharide biosynthesis/export family protein [Granulicella tundricola]|uniref:Soluble ligand binding domain protein n=1 Tax=Granulicella tundricola (strain ATCC BAA-1859 / DSM 23138 / MP5ACTX9) TaxID=1198114 RepID=E8X019_GRATM|nr:polysaccharide biosynthesis/export family protein [Granulicella tundricola]ADW68915.1 Soluble ligand binding domain protein [Granulicella tundricola MP5ACTX9]